MSQANTHYHLAIADLAGRKFEVRQTVEQLSASTLTLRLPTWVPGSYVIREYASHVAWVKASANGQPLTVRKTSKATWEVQLDGANSCDIRYQIYAPELTVRTNDIAHDHAFVHPAATFLMVEDQLDEPVSLSIDLPKDWQAATSLKRDGSGFQAADYHELVDSPIELGTAPIREFEAAGKPHRFVVYGEGNLDLDRMVEDTRKIVEYEVDLFGDLPCEDYLFILLLTDSGGGGLEHCNSSVLAWPKLKFRPEKEYRKYLTLVAHEYFHLWNVKRIRPTKLLNFDYRDEVYTELLWVFEGITSYYDQVVPMCAGVYQPKHYFELLCERVTSERNRPGRDTMSLAESSYDTWIKLYRPTPDSSNTQVSYYERGELIALMLDMHLRESTQGQFSLDDVMRTMYRELYQKGLGLDEDGFADIVQTATGVDCRAELEQWVFGTGNFDLEGALSTVGLRLVEKDRDEDDLGAWLGANVEERDGRSKLGLVHRDGPAHRAGLMSGDEVIALADHRIGDDLSSRLKLMAPGETVSWTAFRRDRLVSGQLTFAGAPHPSLEVKPVPNPTARQQDQFEQWSKVAWTVAFPPSADLTADVTS